MTQNQHSDMPDAPTCLKPLLADSAVVFKKCTGCNLDLEANLNNFHALKKGKYGLRSKCKICCLEYKKEYIKRPEAKESHRIRSQKWRDKNPEEQLKRSREAFKKFKDINNAKSKEKYRTNEDYRLKRLKRDREYNLTGRRKELYRIPKNLQNNLKRNKVYRSENAEKIKKTQGKYIENLSDTLIKIRIGFKKNDDIPKEIIETKRLIIKLKRELKKNKL